MSKKVIRKVATGEANPPEPVRTKLFVNGGSQAVRLPAKWKLETDDVEITFDDESKTFHIRGVSRQEKKEEFLAMIRKMTPAEKAEVKATFANFKRDTTPWQPSKELAAFMKENE